MEHTQSILDGGNGTLNVDRGRDDMPPLSGIRSQSRGVRSPIYRPVPGASHRPQTTTVSTGPGLLQGHPTEPLQPVSTAPPISQSTQQ